MIVVCEQFLKHKINFYPITIISVEALNPLKSAPEVTHEGGPDAST